MGPILLVHVAAGGLALVVGFVALFAAKGAALHRKAGVVFVHAMVTMGLTGTAVAVARGDSSVLGGVLAAYLVVTALTAVRPRTGTTRRVDFGAMVAGLAAGAAGVGYGIESLARGEMVRAGVPVPMLLFLGGVGLLSALSDARLLAGAGLRGPARIRRHLWRMCLALWMASGSFFLGQADELPERFRIFPLLAIPVVVPLLAMAYWLWRVGRGRTARGASDDAPARRSRPLVVAVEEVAR